jgi:hypothetical protein
MLIDLCRGHEVVDRAPVAVGVRTVAIMEAAWRSATAGGSVRISELE